MKEEDTPCTMHNAQWRQQDKNLREALRQEEAALPQMPADLNARLLQRMESEQPKHSRTLWRWMAAAACLLFIVGIGYTLLPQEETPPLTPPLKERGVAAHSGAIEEEGEETLPIEERGVVAQSDSQQKEEGGVVAHSNSQKGRRRAAARHVAPKREEQEASANQEEGNQEPTPDVMSDPFLMAEMHAQQIRTRGMRLYEEIEQQIKN